MKLHFSPLSTNLNSGTGTGPGTGATTGNIRNSFSGGNSHIRNSFLGNGNGSGNGNGNLRNSFNGGNNLRNSFNGNNNIRNSFNGLKNSTSRRGSGTNSMLPTVSAHQQIIIQPIMVKGILLIDKNVKLNDKSKENSKGNSKADGAGSIDAEVKIILYCVNSIELNCVSCI